MEMRKKARTLAGPVICKAIVYSDKVPVDKEQIAKTVCVWAIVVFSFVGFLLGFNLYAPLTAVQTTECEILAMKIYKDADKGMIEIPQGYSVQKTETEISVSQDNHVGIVIATVQNNELVFRYDEEKGRQFLQGLGFTILGALFAGFIISNIAGFVESIRGEYWKSPSKRTKSK